MAFQLQEDLSNLWEEYKNKPISFTEFNKVQQIELEELFDKRNEWERHTLELKNEIIQPVSIISLNNSIWSQ